LPSSGPGLGHPPSSKHIRGGRAPSI
jgi:hypothetical protein